MTDVQAFLAARFGRDVSGIEPLGAGVWSKAFAFRSAGRAPEERHPIHSDLLHFNVLVDPAGDRITGVLDWGCGMYGDFLYDLAWFCFWQPWYPAWERIDFRDEARQHYAAIGLDLPDFDDRFRCCQLHNGLAGVAYQAYSGDWENLPKTARRTIEIS